MFFKEMEIRWSDLDANRHLANSAYIDYGSHTRIHFLDGIGFDMKYMMANQIGPVVFYEHMYYFKEVFAGKIKVSLGLKGLSEKGKFFEFHHDYYDANGKNFARLELMGGWMNLETRKLMDLPEEIMANFNSIPKDGDFRILTNADTRKFAKIPKDLPTAN
ncbi:MAG: thioesterase family protein [Bacteroidota bacterium]